jgi:hypothetical protein
VLKRITLHALWIATALRLLIPSTADPDLWGHVLFGNLLRDGTFPSINGLAYTAPAHPWMNHELLAEGVMAAVYAALGSYGLVALKVALGLATLALVRRSAFRRCHASWAAAVATAVAAVIMTPGFMIRPQLFTLVGLALTLDVLAASRHRARGVAWLLPLLAALWINLHGGVLAGIGLAAIGLVAGAWSVPAAAGRRRGELVRAGVLITLLAAATMVNAYGVRLLWFLVTDVTPRVPITEWAPVALADLSFPLFKATVLGILVWLALARRGRLPETMIVLVAGAAALLHQRHIPLFAVAAAPLLAGALVDVAARLRRRGDLRTSVPVLRGGFAAATALQIVLAVVVIAHTRARLEVDPGIYPVQALRFLAQNGIAGRVALPFDWGEVALWSLPAGSSVAVDGRFTAAYPQDVLDETWRFMRGSPGWNDLLTHYPTDVVVSARAQPPSRLLRNDPEWVYVYSDPLSVVFLRRVPSQTAALARFAAGGFAYDASPIDNVFPALARAPGAGEEPPGAPSSARVARTWTGP